MVLSPGDDLLHLPRTSRVYRGAAIELPALDVRSLLRKHHLDPHKGLGQNFLVDHAALRVIVACADLKKEEQVVEIGAGLGNLTRLLAVNSSHVTAVEIDHKLIPVLREVLASFSNVNIVEGDILELDPRELIEKSGYVVVANIPYYITSAIVRHLLENPLRPSRLILTMQQEVAERICAEPGELSLLALSVQLYGKPYIAATIPASAFYPAPKVDSATLRIDLYPEPFLNATQRDLFFRVVKAAFSQKRKMLRNTLASGLNLTNEQSQAALNAAGIDPTRRAQTVDLVEWRTLIGELQSIILPDEPNRK